MKERELSQKALDILLKSQRDEETDCLIYDFMSKKEKDPKNKKILAKMAADERDHAKMWKSLTKKEVNPNLKLVYWYKFLTIIMGFTFVLKLIQSGETTASSKYADIIDEVPEAKKASEDELRHEYELIEMLDEERLQYVGAMVLGLNDALVELTGTIAGLSFALMNTRIVALSGIITGISATLSMAASNYLAERAENNPNAMKSSVYTGVAYLITVALLVLP